MRYTFTLFICFFYFSNFAQRSISNGEILTTKQTNELFPDSVLKKLNITFPIFKVYKYSDKGGKYYCLLTESQDEIITGKDTLNKKIKAINLKVDNNSFTKTWEINDNIKPELHDESSIWFWTKYIQFSDYDNDGLIDPIIIYGTFGMNNYDDGRVKFIIFYKGKKIAIRHQNGVLDDERSTQIDKSFYSLPIKIQQTIKDKMNSMTANNHAIFPYGWQEAMKNKKVFFSERESH